jgi:hypothetical protein
MDISLSLALVSGGKTEPLPPGLLFGRAGIVLRDAGAPRVVRVLSGAAGVDIQTTGEPRVPRRLSGAAGITLAAGGSPGGLGEIRGGAGITLDASGAPVVRRDLSGAAGIAMGAGGDQLVRREIAGQAGITLSAAGVPSDGTPPSITLNPENISYTPGGNGSGPTLAIGQVALENTTGPYEVFIATHQADVTLDAAAVIAGTDANILDPLTFQDDDGTVSGQELTLTKDMTDGYLSLVVRDSSDPEVVSNVIRLTGVDVDATVAAPTNLAVSNPTATTAEVLWDVAEDGTTYFVTREVGQPAWNPADLNAVIAEADLAAQSVGGGLRFANGAFPVTLLRDDSRYFVAETGADFLSAYTGDTIHVATTGNDTTGDGSSGSPYATLSKAYTEASSLDRISIAPGEYIIRTLPRPMTKNLAWLAPSGGVYLGFFEDMSGSTITDRSPNPGWNVTDPVVNRTIQGFVRKDAAVAGINGSAWATTNPIGETYDGDGIPAIFVGSVSANIFLGDGANLNTLISGGDILFFSDLFTTEKMHFNAGGYVGPGITIASYGTSGQVRVSGGTVVLDGCHIYGGFNECVNVENDAVCIQFDTVIGGAHSDNIDYDNTSIGVEVGILSAWPGTGATDNASTGHDQTRVLRVGGEYVGGSRTIHDVNDTEAYNFSLTVRDARFNDRALMLFGFSSIGSETVSGGYGDITFSGGLTNLIIDTDATVSEVGLSDPWPFA